MDLKTIAALLPACILAACASNSGVVPVGSGNFNIAKQAATGFPGMGNLKAEVHQGAAAYCGAQKQDFAVVAYQESTPPFILGNYPRADLTFRCTK